MANLAKDQNSVNVSGGVSDVDGTTIIPFQVNAVTGRLKVSAILSGSYVTSIDSNLVIPTIVGQNGNVLGVSAGALAWVTSGGVTSVSGTTNRITVTGSATPVVDISASYVGQTSITTLGTIGTGTWQGGVIAGQYGGTGIANTNKTITVGGNFAVSGFPLTLNLTATSTVAMPVSGTLVTWAGTETLTNKTLTSPIIATISNTGTLTLPTSTDTIVARATTDTLTNKNIQFRVDGAGASTSLTPSTDYYDAEVVTSLAGTITVNNPTGSPAQLQRLIIRIKDSGTAHAITWDTQYRGGTDVALPTTTTASKTLYTGFFFNSTDTKWDIMFSNNGY